MLGAYAAPIMSNQQRQETARRNGVVLVLLFLIVPVLRTADVISADANALLILLVLGLLALNYVWSRRAG